nr:B28 [uncultured bacterium]
MSLQSPYTPALAPNGGPRQNAVLISRLSAGEARGQRPFATPVVDAFERLEATEKARGTLRTR